MSRLGKKLVLTALILSMLGCNLQPLFSYAQDNKESNTQETVVAESEETKAAETTKAEETKKTEETKKAEETKKTEESKKSEETKAVVKEAKAEESEKETDSVKETEEEKETEKEEETESVEQKETESEKETASTKETESEKETEAVKETESTEQQESESEKETESTAETETPAESESETISDEEYVCPLADGEYRILSDTDNRMFYMVTDDKGEKRSNLTVKDGKMTVTITLTGVGYDRLYLGTKAEAEKVSQSLCAKYEEVNGYYTYTFEIPEMDKEMTIATHSKARNAWYEHSIIFYSKDAIEIKEDTPAVVPPKKPSKKDEGKTEGTQTKFENDNKADKQSKYKDDANKSTKVVDNDTTLKDGVYTPDGFSWSGGSGRLSYIRCNKLTVKNGKVYATIEFGSSSYDQCKANGRIYYKSGSGNSIFVIPVELNKNNVIIGRTVAMSSPHWIKYNIFIAKNIKGDSKQTPTETDKTVTEKLSEEAPAILGMEATEKTDKKAVIASKYFNIFKYENGVTLIQVDMTADTYMEEVLKEAEKEAKKNSKKTKNTENTDADVEYDEEGKVIAKSPSEITEELYQNQIVNYLVVPEGVEVPAGLDKTYIVIQQPADKSFTASQRVLKFLDRLNKLDQLTTLGIAEEKIRQEEVTKAVEEGTLTLSGTLDALDYKNFVLGKTNLALLPASVLPESIDTSEEAALSVEEQTAAAEAQRETYISLTTRFTALGIPVFVDRSYNEESMVAKAEWVKVYGIIYGCEKKADKWFARFVKKHGTKEEKKAWEENQ